MKSALPALSDIIRDSIWGLTGPEDTTYWNLSGDHKKISIVCQTIISEWS